MNLPQTVTNFNVFENYLKILYKMELFLQDSWHAPSSGPMVTRMTAGGGLWTWSCFEPWERSSIFLATKGAWTVLAKKANLVSFKLVISPIAKMFS